MGLGEPGTGISISQDYLFLAYRLSSNSGMNVTYQTEIYDLESEQLIKSFTSEKPIGLKHNNNFISVSIEGRLELYDLVTSQSNKLLNDNIVDINLGRPSYALVNQSKLILGFGSFISNLDFLSIVDFNQNEISNLTISALNKELTHIPDDVFLGGEAYTADLEKELFIIAYSYTLDSEIKNEVAIVNFNGDLIEFFELPNYTPRVIYIN